MKRILPLLALLMLASCKIEPQPIAFGTDACHFSDQSHGLAVFFLADWLVVCTTIVSWGIR